LVAILQNQERSNLQVSREPIAQPLAGVDTCTGLMPARQASICGDGLPKLDIVFSDAVPGTNSPPPLTTATKKVSRFNVEELETNVRKLFATIDVTGNGYVTLREFERHLALSGVGLDWERVEQIYELIFCPAVDGDGAPSHCRLLTRWDIFFSGHRN
jgi:hypothetical protein